MFCFVNTDLKRLEEAHLGVRDLSILRGYGIFEYFRLRNNKPLFIDEHIERFFQSAHRAYEEVPVSERELRDKISELMRVNQMSESGIRILLTGGYSQDGYSTGRPNLVITQEKVKFPSEENYAHGVKLIPYRHLRELAEVKTISYMTGIWMKKELIREQAFDILYHIDGKISELTRSNFFIIDNNGMLITPEKDVLKGITRKKVLEIGRDIAEVAEGEVCLSDLTGAREAFVTGTTKKVLPVTQVGDQVIGSGKPGPVTLEIMRKFEAVTQEIFNRQAPV